MFTLLVTVCLGVAAFATPIDHEAPRFSFPMTRDIPWGRIVGGQPAKEKQFPYIVSLQYKNDHSHVSTHMCGGVILSSNWILTAANCAIHYYVEDLKFVVRAGMLKMFDREKQVQTGIVTEAHLHYGYSGLLGVNDIALLYLLEPLEFDDYVQPISLPELRKEHTGNVTLSGWGSIAPYDPRFIFPNDLHYVELPIVDRPTCQRVFVESYGNNAPEINENNICTGPLSGGKAPCVADSGDPLVQLNEKSKQMELVGIASYGPYPCGYQRSPSVYIKVSGFTDWIAQIMSSHPDD